MAGKIWKALEGTEGMYLGFGWLLREDKLSTSEVDGELFVKLK